MAQRPPPPPPRRRFPPLERLRRIVAREEERERPFDPERPPEHYARPHHFAINPADPTAGLRGERVNFHDDVQDVLDNVQTYGSWSSAPNSGDWFVSEWLGGSDYSGGFIGKANYKDFNEKWGDHDPPFFTTLVGGHGTYGIAIHIDRAPEDLWPELAALEQYPVWSDETLSDLESDATDEAWSSWARREYKRLWETALEDDETLPEDWVELIDDDTWREHFEECREAANVYWEAQGDSPSMWIDVRRVFDACDESPPLPGASEPESEPSAPSAGGTAGTVAAPTAQPSAGIVDERRRRQIEQLRQELDRPYRRFSPNPPKGMAALLHADPYRGVVVSADSGSYYDGIYAAGVIEANVLHTADPHERAALVMRGPEPDARPMIVLWYGAWVAPRKDQRAYGVIFVDVERVGELPLFTMGRLGNVQEYLEEGEEGFSEELWEDVVAGLHRLLRNKSRAKEDLAALALYLYWYMEAQDMDPPLLDYAVTEGTGPVVYKIDVPDSDFEFAWREVFQTYAKREQQVAEIMHLAGLGPLPPAPPAPASGPTVGMRAAQRRREQIAYARKMLDRPAPRRFEPNAAVASPNDDVNAYLAADPYRGLTLPSGWTLLHNVLYERDPRESAMLLVRGPFGQQEIVYWNAIGASTRLEWNEWIFEHYTVPVPVPRLLVEAGAADDVKRAMGASIGQDEWDKVIRSMRRGAGDAAAIYLRWYRESGAGYLLDVVPGVLSDERDGRDLNEQFAEVFALGDHLRSGGSVAPLREEAPAPVAPAAPQTEERWWLEGPQERQPLGRYSPEQIAAFRARGLVPGYHFNPTLTFVSPNQDVDAYLAGDPYHGRRLSFSGDKIIHNVTYEEDPRGGAVLLTRHYGNLQIVVWNAVDTTGSDWHEWDYEHFVVPFRQLRLPDVLTSAAAQGDVRRAMSHAVDPAEWDRVVEDMMAGLGGPAAIYLRWYLASGVGVSLADIPDVTFDERTGSDLAIRYREVFFGDPAQAPVGVPVAPTEPAPAPMPSPAEQGWWLEGPQEREPLGRYSSEQIAALKARGLIPGYHFNPRLSEGMVPEQFDPTELARGTFVEMEHTDDVDEARRIAMDHLVEDLLYYQKLQMLGL